MDTTGPLQRSMPPSTRSATAPAPSRNWSRHAFDMADSGAASAPTRAPRVKPAGLRLTTRASLPRKRGREVEQAALDDSLPRKRGRVGVGAASGEPLAVYIHWPFCRSKCPYCDFNSHVRERIDEARWTKALLADLGHPAELARDREVVSIFFGGGTPSLMPPDTVAALIARVKALWPAAPNLEVTLEANP